MPKGAHRHVPEGRFLLDDRADWQHPGFEQTDQHPVVCVNCKDAQAFIQWLNDTHSIAPSAAKEGVWRYALPTEAQWEYACRAGTKTAYSSGDRADSLQGAANLPDLSFKPVFLDTGWARDAVACSGVSVPAHAKSAPRASRRWSLSTSSKGSLFERLLRTYAGHLSGIPDVIRTKYVSRAKSRTQLRAFVCRSRYTDNASSETSVRSPRITSSVPVKSAQVPRDCFFTISTHLPSRSPVCTGVLTALPSSRR